MPTEAPPRTRPRRRPAPCDPWPTRAFGIDFEVRFEAPALPRVEGPCGHDPTILELAYADALEAGWEADGALRLGGMTEADGRVLLDIWHHPSRGTMFYAGAHGRYLIAPDGRHVACAVPSVANWYWQRMLIGQILPLVSALRGLQVIHASAAAIGDSAIAVSGPPGAGKSTLAFEFARGGCPLLAEDVVALRLDGDRVMAEPGVTLVNLRPSEAAQAAVAEAGMPILGRSHKIHVQVPRAPAPLPLAAFYLLESAAPGEPVLERISASLPDFLRTAFVPYLTRPRDLLRHLELGAAIAHSIPVLRVGVDHSEPPRELARRIEEHARTLERPVGAS